MTGRDLILYFFIQEENFSVRILLKVNGGEQLNG